MTTNNEAVTGEGTASREELIRYLPAGEIIKDGDQYLDPNTGRWHDSKSQGRKVGVPNCTNLTYRRFDNLI